MKKTNQNIKKLTVIRMTVIIAMLSAALSGCGCQRDGENTATIDEISTSAVEQATVETLNETDQAIVDEGLTVDKDGNITDKEGNRVEVSEDGKVMVKTLDGKTVEVDANKVKDANENNERVQKVNATVNNSSSNNNNGSSKTSSSSNNNSDKKTQSSNSSSSTNKNNSSNNNSSSSKIDTKNDSSSSNSGSSNSKPTTADPHAGKTWHEAEYKTINHPAETKTIHHSAETHEEPVYETVEVQICWGCGARVGNGDMTAEERRNHMKQHHLNGEETGYHNDYVQVQTGTKTVIDKEAWTETVIVKEAWTEKKLIREAGWY